MNISPSVASWKKTLGCVVSILMLTTGSSHAQEGAWCVKRCISGQQQCSIGIEGDAPTEVQEMLLIVMNSMSIDESYLSEFAVAGDCADVDKVIVLPAPLQSEDYEVDRFLLYNSDWLQETHGNNRMAVTWLFAHELAHIYLDHSASKREISRLEMETEADDFAGCAIGRMGGRWSEIEDVVSRLRVLDPTNYPDNTVTQEALFRCSGEPKCFPWNGEIICD